jgi:hypothetical protein
MSPTLRAETRGLRDEMPAPGNVHVYALGAPWVFGLFLVALLVEQRGLDAAHAAQAVHDLLGARAGD